ncbi:MAG: TlpA disulfide reductase family protein [Bacteroidota bacterium]
MKKFKLLAMLLFIIGNVAAQENIEKNALFHAAQMAKCFNSRDYQKYVDYLLPSQYGNDQANKDKYAGMWQKIMASDTAKTEIISVLKFSIHKNQYQALFQNKFRNSLGYVLGISNNNGQNWFFTQFMSTKMQFTFILKMIPSLDSTFSKIIDPRFGKRISYETGKTIAPFKYTDINGNLLSSDSLKGKVIALNFWSITCGPCIAEMPELNALVENMKGKDVVFIAPATHTPKEKLINDFLPKHPFSYDIVLINSDDYSINSFPTHILINQNLEVVDRLTGYHKDHIKKIEQIIDDLLK